MNPIYRVLWRDYLRKRKILKKNLKKVLFLEKEKEKLSFRIEECKKEEKKWLTTAFRGVAMARSYIKKINSARKLMEKAQNAFQQIQEKLELAELELDKSNEDYMKIRSSAIEAGLRKN
jgi:seryl-tRNA synthetase